MAVDMEEIGYHRPIRAMTCCPRFLASSVRPGLFAMACPPFFDVKTALSAAYASASASRYQSTAVCRSTKPKPNGGQTGAAEADCHF